MNNYKCDDLCERYMGKHTFHLKNKDLKIIVQDVGTIPENA